MLEEFLPVIGGDYDHSVVVAVVGAQRVKENAQLRVGPGHLAGVPGTNGERIARQGVFLPQLPNRGPIRRVAEPRIVRFHEVNEHEVSSRGFAPHVGQRLRKLSLRRGMERLDSGFLLHHGQPRPKEPIHRQPEGAFLRAQRKIVLVWIDIEALTEALRRAHVGTVGPTGRHVPAFVKRLRERDHLGHKPVRRAGARVGRHGHRGKQGGDRRASPTGGGDELFEGDGVLRERVEVRRGLPGSTVRPKGVRPERIHDHQHNVGLRLKLR